MTTGIKCSVFGFHGDLVIRLDHIRRACSHLPWMGVQLRPAADVLACVSINGMDCEKHMSAALPCFVFPSKYFRGRLWLGRPWNVSWTKNEHYLGAMVVTWIYSTHGLGSSEWDEGGSTISVGPQVLALEHLVSWDCALFQLPSEENTLASSASKSNVAVLLSLC